MAVSTSSSKSKIFSERIGKQTEAFRSSSSSRFPSRKWRFSADRMDMSPEISRPALVSDSNYHQYVPLHYWSSTVELYPVFILSSNSLSRGQIDVTDMEQPSELVVWVQGKQFDGRWQWWYCLRLLEPDTHSNIFGNYFTFMLFAMLTILAKTGFLALDALEITLFIPSLQQLLSARGFTFHVHIFKQANKLLTSHVNERKDQRGLQCTPCWIYGPYLSTYFHSWPTRRGVAFSSFYISSPTAENK